MDQDSAMAWAMRIHAAVNAYRTTYSRIPYCSFSELRPGMQKLLCDVAQRKEFALPSNLYTDLENAVAYGVAQCAQAGKGQEAGAK